MRTNKISIRIHNVLKTTTLCNDPDLKRIVQPNYYKQLITMLREDKAKRIAKPYDCMGCRNVKRYMNKSEEILCLVCGKPLQKCSLFD